MVKKVTTTCPSCGTSFRVTPQQLAARQGEVRCGHCDTLFNGLETLAMGDKGAPQADAGQDRPAPRRSPSGNPPGSGGSASGADSAEAPVLYHPDFSPAGVGKPAMWLGGSAFLLLLLLAQGMVYFRDAIARDMPGFKPFLSAYCNVVGCRINLPRNADLITIEASDLKQFPDKPNEIVVGALLRNRAAYAQAFPALELTLTDAAGQVIVKRSIQAADYLADNARIEQGIAPLDEANVRLRLETHDVVAVGYRLFVFYP